MYNSNIEWTKKCGLRYSDVNCSSEGRGGNAAERSQYAESPATGVQCGTRAMGGGSCPSQRIVPAGSGSEQGEN